MMARKKRAAGGGRKPRGEFSGLTLHVSMRMPEYLHKQLVREARNRKRSVTQELLRRLSESFDRDRERGRDPALRALLYKIGWIAGAAAEDAYYPKDEPDWRNEWYAFRAFKAAVKMFLDSLEEPSEPPPISAKDLKAKYDRISELGRDERRRVLAAVHSKPPEKRAEMIISLLKMLSEHEPRLAEWEREKFRRHPELAEVEEREIYNLPKATKALELPKKPKS
jgi:hypothetical protein